MTVISYVLNGLKIKFIKRNKLISSDENSENLYNYSDWWQLTCIHASSSFAIFTVRCVFLFLAFSFFVCTKTHMFIQHLNKWSKGLYALDLNGGTRCICKVQKYSVLLFVRMEIPLASLTKTQQQLLVCLHQNMFYPWALMRLNVSLQFNAMNSAREAERKQTAKEKNWHTFQGKLKQSNRCSFLYVDFSSASLSIHRMNRTNQQTNERTNK